MVNITVSMEAAINILDLVYKYCDDPDTNSSILSSIFKEFLKENNKDEAYLVLDFLDKNPLLIMDLLDITSEEFEKNVHNTDPYSVDQSSYMRLCELVLTLNKEESLIMFLKVFTCCPYTRPRGYFHDIDCWNTMLSYELRSLVTTANTVYEPMTENKANRLLAINKALSVLTDY